MTVNCDDPYPHPVLFLFSFLILLLSLIPLFSLTSLLSILFLSSGSQLWVFHWNPWRTALQQGEAPQQRRQVGSRDSRQHTSWLPLPIDPPHHHTHTHSVQLALTSITSLTHTYVHTVHTVRTQLWWMCFMVGFGFANASFISHKTNTFPLVSVSSPSDMMDILWYVSYFYGIVWITYLL